MKSMVTLTLLFIGMHPFYAQEKQETPTPAFDRKSEMIAMRDGVRLATDVYRPKGVTGALPTILIRLPYNKSSYRGATVPADFFASHGYAVVVQDVPPFTLVAGVPARVVRTLRPAAPQG